MRRAQDRFKNIISQKCSKINPLQLNIDLNSHKSTLTHQSECKEVKTMAKNTKQTSKAVASKASKILKDNRYSAKSKSVAGSALAQTKKK